MDNTFSVWQVNNGQRPRIGTSPVLTGATGRAVKIVNICAPPGTATSTTAAHHQQQYIETEATIGVYGGGVTNEIYQHQPGATVMAEPPILLTIPEQRQYLVDESSIQNIDQMPPANLIMGTTADESPPLVNVASGCNDKMFHLTTTTTTTSGPDESSSSIMHPPTNNAGSAEQPQYAEECEVMEEVITDDWVQSQGEECVQVTVDQLGASTIVGTPEDEISVPLDQDEYTLSRPYPCDFCSRRFRKKANLLNHLVAHSNDRPYVCNLCGAQYGRRIDLTNHFKQHAYAANNLDDGPLRSDQEGDYDISGLPMSHGQKHRSQHSSEDEDLFNEGTRAVNYNSQPPMQLISTTTTHSSASRYQDGSCTTTPSSSSLAMSPTFEPVTSYLGIAPTEASKSGATSGQPKRSSARAGKAASTKGARRNATANGYIKKEQQLDAANDDDGQEELYYAPASGGGATMQRHFPVLDERKPFVCQQCGASFGREKALASHSRVHGGDMQYKCLTCGERFWDRTLLQDHIRQQHTDVYPQPISSFSSSYRAGSGSKRLAKAVPTNSSSLLVEGVEVEFPSDGKDAQMPYFCDSCYMVFDRSDLVKKHIQEVHGCSLPAPPATASDRVIVKKELHAAISSLEGTYTPSAAATEEEADDYEHQERLSCREGGLTFVSASDLLQRNKSTHEHEVAEPHECQLCGEKFADESIIKQHVQACHRDQLTSMSCAICGKLCKSQTSLMKHSWDHSRERLHCCSKCGKTFHHMGRLKRHMGSHRNKAVRCEVCGEEFPDGRTLMNHRHSHTKSSNYPCKECGKTFGSRSSQQIHMRLHTGERPYACRFCWKAFADGGTLRKHERVHTGEKPYGCSVCPKEFNQRVVLREHIRAHHSQPDPSRGSAQHPYFCPVCSTLFAGAPELVQHLIEHSDTNTAKKRKPPTFPRKYKRRRKLKPHELERLQSGRRKQKPPPVATSTSSSRQQSEEDAGDTTPAEEMEEDGGGVEEQRYERTVSLHRDDGTLKTSSELLHEYGGDSKAQKLVVVSTNFISPYELLAEEGGASGTSVDVQKRTLAAEDGMLDDFGINLLSDSNVGGKGRTKRRSASKPATGGNNHSSSESLGKRGGGGEIKHWDGAPSSGARMIHTQAKKKGPTSKTMTNDVGAGDGRAKRSKKRPTAATTANPSTKEPPLYGKEKEDESATISHAMEAFSELERSRFRTRPMPSYVREIPSDRISENFPLLDDGNTDDPMEEPGDERTRYHYGGRQRYISSTSSVSASRDDEDEQLLMEISHREKYTDRFNSDIVNDLAEILRSPLKGGTSATAGATSSVPPVDILASPSSRPAGQRQQPASNPSAKKEMGRKKTAAKSGSKALPKSRGQPAAAATSTKQRSTATCTSANATTSVTVAAAATAPYGRRLTRRQLEREVSFLSEAFASEPSTSPRRKTVEEVVMAPVAAAAAAAAVSSIGVPVKQENMNVVPEKLAEMLLNDGIPSSSSSSAASGRSSASDNYNGEEEHTRTSVAHYGHEEDAEIRNNGEATLTNTTTTTTSTNSTTTSDHNFRCSICAECFEDRSQLILHVPVHM